MTGILITIATVTVSQLLLCGFSFWWLLAFIARTMFSMRAIGALIKIEYTYILEGIAIAIMLLWKAMYHSKGWDIKEIIITLAAAVICCTIVTIDNILYVYVVEDEED